MKFVIFSLYHSYVHSATSHDIRQSHTKLLLGPQGKTWTGKLNLRLLVDGLYPKFSDHLDQHNLHLHDRELLPDAYTGPIVERLERISV